jgi:predicted metalloprotease with PDZ domain
MISRAVLGFALCLLPGLANAADRCDVEYRFTARWDEKPRRFDVDLLFDAGNRTSTALAVADDWGPVKDFGRAIRRVRPIAPAAVVSHDTGRAASWTVDHPAGARVHVRYEMRNDVASVDDTTPLSNVDFYRTMLGATWFQFYGHGALLIPQDIADRPLSACLTFSGLPKGWAFASSHGEGQRHGDAIAIRTSASPDALREALFLGGDFRVHRREARGGPLVFALRGRWTFDDAKLVDLTARIVGAHREFWRDRFPHYLVSLVPNRSKEGETGGTGLYRAFAMYASDDFAVPSASFDHLIAHEDLHTWVPRRLGASGTDEARRYWFSEGFTDYLTHRLLLASGAWTLEDYARALDEKILAYESSPARNASNADLARGFWNDGETQRMAYTRGELIALRWADAMASRGASLQDALRSLLLPTDAAEDGNPEKLAAGRLLAALRPHLGAQLDRDVTQFVDDGSTIPIDADFLGPCFFGHKVGRPLFDAGFDAEASVAARAVTRLEAGGPAEKAGLREGMKLVGWSIRFGDTHRTVRFKVEEDGRTRIVEYLPHAPHPVETYEFARRDDALESPTCRAWIEAR